MGNIIGFAAQCLGELAKQQNQQQQYHYQPQQGDSVDSIRHSADDLFQRRNAAFEQSKACYNRGDHEGARKYSEMGKQLDRQAKAVSKQAADVIYNQKNQGRPSDEIDLHGLTVAEATARVEDALREAKRAGRQHLVIIVGKGLHSGPGGPRLKPAITELIQKHNLRCTVGRPNEGCLYVEFVSAEERGWFGDMTANCTIM